MHWFDCNLGFGIPVNAPATVIPTARMLLEAMDFCGVAEALVYHVAVHLESAQTGNRLVVEETGDQPRLHPTWAILPPQTGELGTIEDFLAGMRRHRVKALRAYPEEHRYLLNSLTFGGLFDELVARGIPLLVGPHWQNVTELLADFPQLTLIVAGHGDWGDDRYFRPLIERCPRFHIDTSNYQLAGGIADLVNKYGPHRLLYGSGAPDLQMGGALLTVAHADISDEAKTAIAGENLRRLLGEVNL